MNTKIISTTKKIFLIYLASVILIAIPFWVKGCITQNKLTKADITRFDITAITNLAKEKIKEEAEIHNGKAFIEYQCLYGDSCLRLIDIGKVAPPSRKTIREILKMTWKPIPSADNYWSSITSSPPYIFEAATIRPWYNVDNLPAKAIEDIKMKISGRVLKVEQVSDCILKYKLRVNYVTFLFNGKEEADLGYGIGADGSITDADFTFYIDKNTYHVYIIVTTKAWVSTITA